MSQQHRHKQKKRPREELPDNSDFVAGDEGVGALAMPLGVGAPKNKGKKTKGKANDHVKDPTEATLYLEQWDAGAGWRFNKSTQAWILRHMYRKDKVLKEPFKVLLRYLKDLKGAARDRTKAEAEEIVDLEGGFTKAEREVQRLESEATNGAGAKGKTNNRTAANTAANAEATDVAPVATDAKEAGRVAAFRLLRAKKVLLALATNGESSDSD